MHGTNTSMWLEKQHDGSHVVHLSMVMPGGLEMRTTQPVKRTAPKQSVGADKKPMNDALVGPAAYWDQHGHPATLLAHDSPEVTKWWAGLAPHDRQVYRASFTAMMREGPATNEADQSAATWQKRLAWWMGLGKDGRQSKRGEYISLGFTNDVMNAAKDAVHIAASVMKNPIFQDIASAAALTVGIPIPPMLWKMVGSGLDAVKHTVLAAQSIGTPASAVFKAAATKAATHVSDASQGTDNPVTPAQAAETHQNAANKIFYLTLQP